MRLSQRALALGCWGLAGGMDHWVSSIHQLSLTPEAGTQAAANALGQSLSPRSQLCHIPTFHRKPHSTLIFVRALLLHMPLNSYVY